MVSCQYCKALLPTHTITLFCSECGIPVTNFEEDKTKMKNQNIKKVNVKFQIILTIIPFMILLALYKINKVKKGLMIYLITFFISIFPFFPLYLFFSDPFYIIFILWISPSLVVMYYVIKWSKYWNRRLNFLENL